MIQTTSPVRVLLIDEFPIFHLGLQRVLAGAPDFVLARCATSFTDTLPAPAIDLVMVDIAATKNRGVGAIRDLRARLSAPVLVFTRHDERLFAERCLKAGAAGFIMKSATPAAVLVGLRHVAQGMLHVSEQVKAMMLQRMSNPRIASGFDDFDRLSDRELLIVEQIGLSKNNKEIARELQISVKTIESHRSRIKAKLQLDTPQDLMRYAMRLHRG